ncbi:uncharacterized protein Triagg1_8644 [Trichoderma aggressivum f. europaeum]|uniref:Uncharacterized protein n=1 Tax=Trichoderma aggressivum f. europaeum TaxID=173218 RepID=A0AAE1IBT6_9HYPO|nr:hypothetical protein Triagg1_8644 [Trichoderma aggressivum f. europaeum]
MPPQPRCDYQAHRPDGDFLQRMHSDLARLYNDYKWQIRAIWHRLNRHERARPFMDHEEWANSDHHSWNEIQDQREAMFSDINRKDYSTSAKYLLNHLEHRATTSLFQQYWAGVDGALGDGPFITEKVNQKQLIPRGAPNYYMIFTEDCYGDTVKLDQEDEGMLELKKAMTEIGSCVSSGTGNLIHNRQLISTMEFRDLILGLLDKIPQSWWTKVQWEKVERERMTAGRLSSKPLLKMSRGRKAPEKLTEEVVVKLAKKLSAAGLAPEKTPLARILFRAQESRDYLEEYLAILRDEPSVLVYNANSWLLSRPELVTDEKGRHLPLETDKYISCAIFEAIRGWVQKFAIWSYICDLLEMLDNTDTRPDYQQVILQEISNVCHFEYSRAQAHFIRHVQTGIGADCFRRVANTYDDAGNPKVFMKIKPQELSQGDPLLQYMLRLCQSQTRASQATEWFNHFDRLYNSKQSFWKPLQQREMDAMCELIMTAAAIQEFSMYLPVPSLSRKTGQTFLEAYRELNSGLNDIRKEIDLQESSVPITKLLEPGMANKALAQLDDFVERNMGSKMDFFYHYAVQECLVYHRAQSRKTEDTPEGFPFTIAYCTAEGVDLKKFEENTTPVQTSTSENEQATNELIKAQLRQLDANPAAKKVFTTLFKKPKAGVFITWAAFESAMVAMGFRVKKGRCADYTFIPPRNMPVTATLLVARPVNSKIEGHSIPILARHLKKTYGKLIPFG